MKVHRLIITRKVADGRVVSASEHTLPITEALDGICNIAEAPEFARKLEDGVIVRKKIQLADQVQHICITPVHAKSRESLVKSGSIKQRHGTAVPV